MCSATQNPLLNNCSALDGYNRTLIYRSWNTSCPPLVPDFYKTMTYSWDYHGAWYWGLTAVLRCLPGYVIPAAYENVSKHTSIRYFFSVMYFGFPNKRLKTNVKFIFFIFFLFYIFYFRLFESTHHW